MILKSFYLKNRLLTKKSNSKLLKKKLNTNDFINMDLIRDKISKLLFLKSDYSEETLPESGQFVIIRPFYSGLAFKLSTVGVSMATVVAVTTIIACTVLLINKGILFFSLQTLVLP